MKQILITATFIFALFIAGVPVAHAALTDAQVQSILDLLASFNADQTTLDAVASDLGGTAPTATGGSSTSSGGTSSGSSTTTTNDSSGSSSTTSTDSSSSVCLSLSRSLGIGSEGNDVERLQQYLRDAGDFTFATNTGYFGTVTENAVKQWQARNGVVSSGGASTTGYGVVGPKTRAAMNANCDSDSSGSSNGETTSFPTAAPKPTSEPSVESFTSSVDENASDNAVTLSWTSVNVSSCSLSEGGLVIASGLAANGSHVVTPSESTSYVLTCSGDGSQSDQVFITVQVAETAQATAPPTCSLTSSLLSPHKNEEFVLSWTSENATKATFNQNTTATSTGNADLVLPVGDVSLNGSFTAYSKSLLLKHVIELVVEGDLGEGSCTIDISVVSPTSVGNFSGKIDGNEYVFSPGVTRNAAFDNCALKQSQNPDSVVTCTWKGDAIYP